MKALYIYNPHNSNELQLIERAKAEMTEYIDVVSIEELPVDFRKYIRATPALITITDDMQGSNLFSEDVDGSLLATAILNKRLEEEELAIHQAETYRLDNMINAEKTKAIDEYTLELVEGGLL